MSENNDSVRNKSKEQSKRREIPKATDRVYTNPPVGRLGIVPVKGTENLASLVNSYLVEWRNARKLKRDEKKSPLYEGYTQKSYIRECDSPRFGTGEGKGVITSSVRGDDLYFIVDVTNTDSTYRMGSYMNHYSPDDHYQDLKRVISAASGSAKRMTVIMPYLYEGRVNKRDDRSSLDCASMLQELIDMGVSEIITFDAHEPRVQNAIPLNGFNTIAPVYQYVKALTQTYDDLDFSPEHMMIISPDKNGMSRAVFFGNTLGLDIGMYYRRRDYSQEGYPEVALEFLGADPAGKDIIIIDDLISSGGALTEVSRNLKKRGARRVFCCASFGLFTQGTETFRAAFDAGIIDRVFTTNLIYQKPEVLEAPWHVSVDMSKFIALLIDNLNHDESIIEYTNPVSRISIRLENYRLDQAKADGKN